MATMLDEKAKKRKGANQGIDQADWGKVSVRLTELVSQIDPMASFGLLVSPDSNQTIMARVILPNRNFSREISRRLMNAGVAVEQELSVPIQIVPVFQSDITDPKG